jgi:hypothetical protein
MSTERHGGLNSAESVRVHVALSRGVARWRARQRDVMERRFMCGALTVLTHALDGADNEGMSMDTRTPGVVMDWFDIYTSAMTDNAHPSLIHAGLRLTMKLVRAISQHAVDRADLDVRGYQFRRIVWYQLPALLLHADPMVRLGALEVCSGLSHMGEVVEVMHGDRSPPFIDDLLIETDIVSMRYMNHLLEDNVLHLHAIHITVILDAILQQYAYGEAWEHRFPHLIPLLIRICRISGTRGYEVILVTSALRLVRARLSTSRNEEEIPKQTPPRLEVKAQLLSMDIIPLMVRAMVITDNPHVAERNVQICRVLQVLMVGETTRDRQLLHPWIQMVYRQGKLPVLRSAMPIQARSSNWMQTHVYGRYVPLTIRAQRKGERTYACAMWQEAGKCTTH